MLLALAKTLVTASVATTPTLVMVSLASMDVHAPLAVCVGSLAVAAHSVRFPGISVAFARFLRVSVSSLAMSECGSSTEVRPVDSVVS